MALRSARGQLLQASFPSSQFREQAPRCQGRPLRPGREYDVAGGDEPGSEGPVELVAVLGSDEPASAVEPPVEAEVTVLDGVGTKADIRDGIDAVA